MSAPAESTKQEREREEFVGGVATIRKGPITKRDKTSNRKKVFNTKQKCKTKYQSHRTQSLWFSDRTSTPRSQRLQTSYPKVKSDCPKPPHPTVHQYCLQFKWGKNRGKRLVEKKGERERRHMQTSQWERARCRVVMYPCTCYMRLSPLVQSQTNTHNPVTLGSQGRRGKIQRSRGGKGWQKEGAGHRVREHLLLTLIYRQGNETHSSEMSHQKTHPCFL